LPDFYTEAYPMSCAFSLPALLVLRQNGETI